jgi:anti-anti-sigma factor
MLSRNNLLEIVWENGKVEVHITEPILDEINAEAMRLEVASLLDRLAGLQVVFDLSDVEFLTSSSLGIFLTILKRLRGVGGTLTLRNVRPEIFGVFTTTRLTDLLNVHEAPCMDRSRAEV